MASSAPSAVDSVATPRICPARVRAADPPGATPPEQISLDYWLAQLGDRADDVVLDQPHLRAHGQALLLDDEGAPRVVDLAVPLEGERLRQELSARIGFLRNRLQEGKYRSESDGTPEVLGRALEGFRADGELRVALSPVVIRCGPSLAVLRSVEGDPRFDRNSCSVARAQEPVEVLGRWPNGPRFVRTAFALGFIADDAPLSAPVPEQLQTAFRSPPAAQVIAEAGLSLDAAAEKPAVRVPPWRFLHGSAGEAAGTGRVTGPVWAAGPGGFRSIAMTEPGLRSTAAPLTRADLLRAVFRNVGSPYGWGGQGGGRDCSRLLLDAFRTFGLPLPRISRAQSKSGSYVVEVPAQASALDRLALLDEADQRGVVLLHFPGHIMLYLGRDDGGVPRVVHAFAEYVEPCGDGPKETLYEVERVTVSGLDLGAGSSRRSFLERLTRITVFGAAPGFELAAFARFRASAPAPLAAPKTCDDSLDVALFRSPRRPLAGQPLRVVAVSTEDQRPAGLFLTDPAGQRHSPEFADLGVGPFARVATLSAPMAGRWTVQYADGGRVIACERFLVHRRAAADEDETARGTEEPAWLARWRWERDVEGLYSAFVEQLFSHPVQDERTWDGLMELLRDPERNLLHDHLGLDEDRRLRLRPDCADLPYFLRAYFAWKVGLPFAYRRCRRGRAGQPPRCSEPISNETPTEGDDPVAAFERYVRRGVGRGVHSASGRTLPDDENSDMYPLPLQREALRPGSVFNDPYGHLIVVAKWVPQGLGGKGMLLGADAQPDATVGRRRFWRGSFLFVSDTTDVGAGFKAFRPLARDPEAEVLVPYSDALLKESSDFAAPSMEQYSIGTDGFYGRMRALIFPRPLELGPAIVQLVDALEEQVRRRVVSVETGERFMKSRSWRAIDMPEGYAIFETTGPWEDYATPSRDMRLLIAMDTVQEVVRRAQQAPDQFGLADGESAGAQAAALLEQALLGRRFSYARSDGERQDLSLAQLMKRGPAMQMAYNPNDCVELRWGAAEGSDEAASCERYAPEPQRRRMASYRSWFETRTRPPRR